MSDRDVGYLFAVLKMCDDIEYDPVKTPLKCLFNLYLKVTL